MTNAELIDRLVGIMKSPISPVVRRERLAFYCLQWSVSIADQNWRGVIWGKVQDRTCCADWDDIMNKGKH